MQKYHQTEEFIKPTTIQVVLDYDLTDKLLRIGDRLKIYEYDEIIRDLIARFVFK